MKPGKYITKSKTLLIGYDEMYSETTPASKLSWSKEKAFYRRRRGDKKGHLHLHY